ncbi:MAG TPA: hypothetical protein VHC20_06240 [Candidatus Paceibacterota bacterium]|nr:hypothetical protein [Candidatus Paceibacterota bacterium]
MKIKCLDGEGGGAEVLSEHTVWVVEDRPDAFHFLCPGFPHPSEKKKYFVGGRQIEVSVLRTDIEDGREVIYFSGVCLPQP